MNPLEMAQKSLVAKKAKKDNGEKDGNAKERRSNPFIDVTNPKANIKKYGKAIDKRAAKMAALSAMRKKKMK